MAKAQLIEGKLYRLRRGKLVEIPEIWVGKQTTDATKRKRLSHLKHKDRKKIKNFWQKESLVEKKIREDDRSRET